MTSEQLLQPMLEDESPYFVRIYRRVIDDYRIHKKLVLNEFVVLLWLHFVANPYNGLVNTSYAALSAELSGRFSTNEMNKICLSLKRKKYIHFEKQQGRRSSFNIFIDDFPLTSGSFKKVYDKGLPVSSRTETRNDDSNQEEVPTDQAAQLQKLEDQKYALVNTLSVNGSSSRGRSANKDIDNYKNKEIKLKADFHQRNLFTNHFEPTNNAEAICKEVAEAIEEPNLKRLLSVYEKYGLHPIEEVYDYITPILAGENGLQNTKAFFYSKLNDWIRNNSP